MRNKLILISVVVLSSTLLFSCARVKPWERENLSKKSMIFGADSEEQIIEQHVLQNREGSAGGYGSGGGGCGCN